MKDKKPETHVAIDRFVRLRNAYDGLEGNYKKLYAAHEELLKGMEDLKNTQDEMSKSHFNKGWDNGVLYALARLIEMHDFPSIALEILDESQADVSNATECDVEFLRRERPSLPRGQD